MASLDFTNIDAENQSQEIRRKKTNVYELPTQGNGLFPNAGPLVLKLETLASDD